MNTKPIIGIAPNYSYEKKEYTLSEDYVLAPSGIAPLSGRTSADRRR